MIVKDCYLFVLLIDTFLRLRPAKAAQSQQKGPGLLLLLLLLLLLRIQGILCLSACACKTCARVVRSAQMDIKTPIFCAQDAILVNFCPIWTYDTSKRLRIRR